MCRFSMLCVSLVADGYFYHSVFFVLKDAVRLFYAAEREAVCDEWRSVYLALFYESQHFLAVAAVYAASLECEVFAVHVG